MPLLSRKRLLLAKTEVTYGTDPTPTGAANAILVRNLDVMPLQGDIVSRDLVRSYLGGSDAYLNAPYARIEFEVEMAGAGAAGTSPAYDALLKACGMSAAVSAGVSVTYSPISATLPSATLYVNVDGVLHKVTGARGNVSLSLVAGEIPFFKFSFIGLYNAATDTAAPVPTYTGFKAPFVVNADNTSTFSLFGYAAVMKSVQLDFNNELVFRSLVGAEDVQLVNRDISGNIVIEAPTIAAKDFFSIGIGNALGTLNMVHGVGAGNILQIVGTNSVSAQNPTYQDENGIQMLNIPVRLVPVSGNDEITIQVK